MFRKLPNTLSWFFTYTTRFSSQSSMYRSGFCSISFRWPASPPSAKTRFFSPGFRSFLETANAGSKIAEGEDVQLIKERVISNLIKRTTQIPWLLSKLQCNSLSSFLIEVSVTPFSTQCVKNLCARSDGMHLGLPPRVLHVLLLRTHMRIRLSDDKDQFVAFCRVLLHGRSGCSRNIAWTSSADHFSILGL